MPPPVQALSLPCGRGQAGALPVDPDDAGGAGGPRAVAVDGPGPVAVDAPRGWHACLELRFVAGGRGTRLAGNRHHGPLRLLKALRSEDERRLEAVIVHPPGGLVGGDSLSIDLRLDPAARVLATTPGAQKWYRGAATATARTRLAVADGATLEWLPQPSLLYDGAQARQTLRIDMTGSACCLGWEILIRGRAAMGEVFESGHVDQTLSISVDQALLWQERLCAAAGDRLFDSPLGWERRRIAASVWCCAPGVEPGKLHSLRDRWRTLLDPAASGPGRPPALGGATLPADGLLLAKLLADDAEQLTGLCRQLWRAARLSLEGAQGSAPRIWRT